VTRRVIRLTIVAAAALAACTGSTSVRPFGGTYALATVNGSPVPQPEYPQAINPMIVGGVLTVGPDTLYFVLSLQPVDAGGHAAGDAVPFESRIPYSRRGDSLELEGEGPGAGTILGSSVRLVLVTPPSSTGISALNTYLFTPR